MASFNLGTATGITAATSMASNNSPLDKILSLTQQKHKRGDHLYQSEIKQKLDPIWVKPPPKIERNFQRLNFDEGRERSRSLPARLPHSLDTIYECPEEEEAEDAKRRQLPRHVSIGSKSLSGIPVDNLMVHPRSFRTRSDASIMHRIAEERSAGRSSKPMVKSPLASRKTSSSGMESNITRSTDEATTTQETQKHH